VERGNITGIVRPNPYATAADFEQIFTEEMNALYLLSFLLTGNREKAEECFVSGIGECATANRVFKEWAGSWARRVIIRNAIRLVAPMQHLEEVRNPAAARTMDKLPLVPQEEVSAILELKPFERFVFVISALERYSDQDCSILLACTRRNVVEAKASALKHLGALMKSQLNPGSESTALRENLLLELTISRYFPRSAWNRTDALSPLATGA
jgi:DNA-directed RNA polymerase specialized sigma24 family protein